MTPTLRIAMLSEHASPVALLGGADAGGQNVYVDEVSRNLARLGYAVDVFTRLSAPDQPALIEWAPGVRVVNLAFGPPEALPKDRLWPLMPAFRRAILHFMLSDGARYDLIHGNFWMSGRVACELQRQLGIPAVQIFHAMGRTKQRHQCSADTSPADRIAVEEEIVQEASRLIAQCPAEKAELLDDYGADPRKIAIIPSAVNCERFYPVLQHEARQRLGLRDDELILVYVGRILPRKDIGNIVRAVALLTTMIAEPLRLLVVGGETATPDPAATPEIGVLQRLAAELGIADRVIFTGKRQPDELRDYYGASDLVVTTPWYEPFGLTPLEAMACGRPVVGSNVGGISFTVQDEVTGVLVPPRDPPALAEQLARLLLQPPLCIAMGRAALARIQGEFTWENVARRTAALYSATLTGGEQARSVGEATATGAARRIFPHLRRLSDR